ncbi:DUF2141 domain-containing protein [bacterium]|nr:DUF2141 domain-containing protein [bacterium]
MSARYLIPAALAALLLAPPVFAQPSDSTADSTEAQHAATADSAGVDVTFDISGFRNDDGLLMLALHNSEDTFPKKPEEAFRLATAEIIKGQVTITFVNLPPGEYALIYFHDEDLDEELDSNFLRIPKEGYGTSTVVKAGGPPSWDDAVFEVTEKPVRQALEVKYW